MQSIITKSERGTQKLADELAKKLVKKSVLKSTLIIALEGELGSGKTAFAKGFSKALGIREKVLSPTFVLIHKHKIKKMRFKNLYHVDAYRINSEKDLLKLGIKETFAKPKNIIIIEWADRVKKTVPKDAVWIHFEHVSENKRKISIDKTTA